MEILHDPVMDDIRWLMRVVQKVVSEDHVDAEGTLALNEALMTLQSYEKRN